MIDTIKVNVSKRFNHEGKVFAYDVKIDGVMHSEVTKSEGLILCQQAFEVSQELGMACTVHGHNYFFN